MNSAAELLEDLTLENGWVVKEKIPVNKNSSKVTGGNFSVGYKVEKDGRVAFLKALDFSKVFINSADMTVILQEITSEFNYEKDILETCREAGIKKVVKLLANGVVEVENSIPPSTTPYLIFEWAESDVRKETVNQKTPLDQSWILRCMHGITSGLYQLHQRQIIHQDIKPSNVLVFTKDDDVKIGDFGRSYSANHKDVKHNEDNNFPGDITYAPPEILYGYATGSHELIRRGVDVYMLGSMLYFFLYPSSVDCENY